MSRIAFKYLPVRGRLESTCLFLSSIGEPWQTTTLDWVTFRKEKRKSLPFGGQLPLMTVTTPEGDTVTTSQSKNILKTLRDIHRPQNLLDRITTDEYVDAADDLSPAQRMMNFPGTHGAGDAVPQQLKLFKFYLKFLEKTSLSETQFLVSETATIADFSWFHIVDVHRCLAPGVLDKSPNVTAWLERIETMDGVKEYLERRPPLSELGENTLPKK